MLLVHTQNNSLPHECALWYLLGVKPFVVLQLSDCCTVFETKTNDKLAVCKQYLWGLRVVPNPALGKRESK